MKISISSLIESLKVERAAAKQAINDPGHDSVMAEDFQSQPRSSQVAGLDGVRRSSAVVLILSGDYSAKQPSGLSATHEEYREARAVQRPVFAFISDGDRDPSQQEFVGEVEHWQTGLFRKSFRTPEELRAKTVQALHE